MDKNMLTVLLICAVFILLVFTYNFYISNKRRKIQIREIEKNFGKKHTNKYKVNEKEIFDALGGNIDDTTFNDINLSSFIKKFNHTITTPGIQSFYYRLRNVENNSVKIEKIISRRKSLLENESVPKKIQLMLFDVGNFKGSVIELLSEKVEIEDKLKILTYAFSFTVVYIIIGFLLMNKNFIFFAILIIIMNIYLYKYFNKMTFGSLNGLTNLSRVLKFARDFEKEDFKLFEEENKRLKEINKKLEPLYKSNKGITLGTGSVELDFLEMYINILILSEARRFIKSYKYIEKYKDDILELYKIVGSIDDEIASVSLYKAYDLKDVNFIDKGIYGKNLINPLLDNPVANDFIINENSILLTGSNSSGKSTYLRIIGINMILSQCYGFIFGESLDTEVVKLKSSIDISDSILNNISYFMAEAKEIKKIIDNDNKELILLDEIFKGTNTIDRISAATATLKYISKNNYVVAATHDIELTENLKNVYKNYHFEENIVDSDIKFDYKLKEGPTTSRNAIEILKSLDYPEEVIEESKNMAKNLEKKKESIN